MSPTNLGGSLHDDPSVAQIIQSEAGEVDHNGISLSAPMKPAFSVVTPGFQPAEFPEPAWYRLLLRPSDRRRRGAAPPETERIVHVSSAVELQAIQRELGERLLGTEALQVHQCSTCQKREAWLSSWQWYGSYETAEGGSGLIFKTCSDACRAVAIETGLAPADAEQLDE